VYAIRNEQLYAPRDETTDHESHEQNREFRVRRLLRLQSSLALVVMASITFSETEKADIPRVRNWLDSGIILEPGFSNPRSSGLVPSTYAAWLVDCRLQISDILVVNGEPRWLRRRYIIIAVESDPTCPFHGQIASTEESIEMDLT
jgi:hypothetical protein